MTGKILIVDDEADLRLAMRGFLRVKGYDVVEAASCREAEDAFLTARPDAVIVDYQLPDGTAVDVLPRLREMDPGVPIVILTGHATVAMAVHAMKEGADQFLTKPIELPALLIIVERLLEHQRDRRKQLARKTQLPRTPINPFLGRSDGIRELASEARRFLSTGSPILILGETGTGKSVLARWIHDNSPRAEEAFVDLNCAGLSREFLETELFGHEKGAFTGAVAAKAGLLEVAHRGTVFLDEIGDVDVQVQPKLLKVLEEKRFRRMGDVRDRHVDIHLIAATHQDLASLVRDKRFRSDLYFRINTIPLLIPPLRHRSEDIAFLASWFLDRFGADRGRGAVTLSPDAERALKEYSWPGNIRELRNVLERAVLLSETTVLSRGDLRFDSAASTASVSIADSSLTLEENERYHIERVLVEEKGKVDRAARRLGLVRSALYKKIKKHGITIPK